MDMKQALDAISRFRDLSREEMHSVMNLIMTGQATNAQIAGFLVGLRMKGETVDEITASAEVMRKLATPVSIQAEKLVDIVGTGGDSANIFNVSTCSSIVVAAAGGTVAKHGNRSISSSSGSADLLDAAGVNLNLNPQQVAQCVEQLNLGFMFAPQHHSAMRHAVPVRGEMGIRTIFNILGPLTNPAGAQYQLLGVYTPKLVRPLAEVLGNLQLKHALVICSDDGLDEISIAAPTQVAEWRNGRVIDYTIKPEDFGFQRQSLDPLRVNSAQESLQLVQGVLNNQDGPAKDMVLLNSGAALFAADVASSIQDGIHLAKQVLASGQAKAKLADLVKLSQSFASTT